MKAESIVRAQSAEGIENPKRNFMLSALNSPLRIGYDGKRAVNNLTGLGNYSRWLIDHLAQQFPENQYLVYSPKAGNAKKFSLFNRLNVHVVTPNEQSTKLLWRSFGIKKQLVADQIDLFHGLSHEIPFRIQLTKIKSIVTIHDLIFLRKPAYYKFIDRKIYKFKSKYACTHADKIIAISEQTKQDIVALYQIDPAKIEVIYQSCDDSFKQEVSPAAKEEVSNKYQLPKQYILNIGTIEERKNLLLLIRALPQIDKAYSLVVIGKTTAYTTLVMEEIKRLQLEDRVHFLKNIPFSELPAIYQMASTFIYPSFYEGFGIPIIEALYGKVPVIAATGSCLEEAGGPNSIYVDPNDVTSLAQATNKVLHDQQLQEHMKKEGLLYVQKFNNDVLSKQLMNCYLKTLES